MSRPVHVLLRSVPAPAKLSAGIPSTPLRAGFDGYPEARPTIARACPELAEVTAALLTITTY